VAGRLQGQTRVSAVRFPAGSAGRSFAALRQLRRSEIRTAAGPSSAVQCVFSGGPYTTASQVRQCQEGLRERVR